MLCPRCALNLPPGAAACGRCGLLLAPAWIRLPEIEPDTFWGDRAVPRFPRFAEAAFFPTPRPATTPFWDWATTSRLRIVLAILGAGFFAVFVDQGSLLYQLVVGAPVFEEFLKLGLALLLTYPLGVGRPGTRGLIVTVRLLVAWGIGAGFGVLEHFVTYDFESTRGYLERILFHSGACGLSMATFCVFEALPDKRFLFLSTLFATVLHWSVNFSAIPLGLVGGVTGLPIDEALAITAAMATFVATAMVLAQRDQVREFTVRTLRSRLGRASAAT